MPGDNDEHLSHIVTMWTVVFKAHRAEGQASPDHALSKAQAALLERYAGAIYRYVLAAVRDPHAADDLAQDFALGMCRGLFKNANPDKGRFRDYVKTTIAHLIAKYYQKQKKQPLELAASSVDPADTTEEGMPTDDSFIYNWRQELLARTWEALADVERESGQPFHTFLDHRTRNPNTSSAQMASEFTQKLGKPLSADSVRQTLHRARHKFAELLLEEVARSLETREREELERELIDLGLYEYCKDRLKQWV